MLLMVSTFMVVSVKADSNSTGVAVIVDPFVPVEWDPDRFRFDPWGLFKQYKTNFIGLMFAIFYMVMGDLFLGVLMFIICWSLYRRFDSVMGPLTVLVIFGASLSWLLPVSLFRIQYLFLGLGIAGILYKLFGEKG